PQAVEARGGLAGHRRDGGLVGVAHRHREHAPAAVDQQAHAAADLERQLAHGACQLVGQRRLGRHAPAVEVAQAFDLVLLQARRSAVHLLDDEAPLRWPSPVGLQGRARVRAARTAEATGSLAVGLHSSAAGGRASLAAMRAPRTLVLVLLLPRLATAAAQAVVALPALERGGVLVEAGALARALGVVATASDGVLTWRGATGLVT